MGKKNFIVLSDNGANSCQHYEFDTLEDAKKGATEHADTTSLAINFAIYQKIAVTEMVPLKSLLRDILQSPDVPKQESE